MDYYMQSLLETLSREFTHHGRSQRRSPTGKKGKIDWLRVSHGAGPKTQKPSGDQMISCSISAQVLFPKIEADRKSSHSTVE